jgi:leucyl aminopeptidase
MEHSLIELNINAKNIVVIIDESLTLTKDAITIDNHFGSIISLAIKENNFKGTKKDSLKVTAMHNGILHSIFLIGAGKPSKAHDFITLGGRLFTQLNAAKINEAYIIASSNIPELIFGAKLKSYKFDKYKTKQKPEDKISLSKLQFVTTTKQECQAQVDALSKLSSAIYLTRDLVSEPPNVIYPESFAAKCKELEQSGLKVEILDENEMKKLGMGALLGVGQGSQKPSRLVIMQWNGADKEYKPLAFVGKGVTFDTGGISLKPANGMEDMKYDMAGAAAVTGIMKSLADRKAKVNAVGIIGLVENMPDGNAQRPSDIVTSMSGQTIEVLNTDAEGRLVLCDALWYCQDRFKPQFMIDFATLTGAIVISLGNIHAGLFSNNDDLANKLLEAGKHSGEKLWRMPLGEEYDRQIDSKVADMQNIGAEYGSGSITAAQFLARFVNDTPWAHLDIAGMAWTKKDLDITPKGATAFGVRLIDDLVKRFYE